jgi:hypothetical protein
MDFTELQTQNYLFSVVVAGAPLRVFVPWPDIDDAQRPATRHRQLLPRTGSSEFVGPMTV